MKQGSRQLTLDLPVKPRYGREDFLVSPSNAHAWNMFESWPNWPDRVLLLLGPTGAGKSHLGAIWAARTDARVLSAAAMALARMIGTADAVHTDAVKVVPDQRAPHLTLSIALIPPLNHTRTSMHCAQMPADSADRQ